jgi:soluble lytic murein transglycosylase-like protein
VYVPEPTPAPVQTTVAAASVPVYTPIPYSGGVEQWRPLVASIFPAESVDAALRVIACESGGNANATGAAGERGLFQVHPIHWDSSYDPEANVRAALRISGGYSWNAWTCKP